MMTKNNRFSLFFAVLFLVACSTQTKLSTQADLSTQAPNNAALVSQLSDVIVCFNKVELIGQSTNVSFHVGNGAGMIPANNLCVDSDNQVIANTVGLNLLNLTGSDSVAIMQSIAIPAGQYSKLRVALVDGSYAISGKDKLKYAVTVPSNQLTLDGFTAGLGGKVDLLFEFDIANALSLTQDNASYQLKSQGFQLVDNNREHATLGQMLKGDSANSLILAKLSY